MEMKRARDEKVGVAGNQSVSPGIIFMPAGIQSALIERKRMASLPPRPPQPPAPLLCLPELVGRIDPVYIKKYFSAVGSAV